MTDFSTFDFRGIDISVCIFVRPGQGQSIHTDRKFHGLVIFCEGSEYEYKFSDGKTLCAHDDSILYLPKHSSYTVTAPNPCGCYAINFDIPKDITLGEFVIKLKNPSDVIQKFKKAANVWSTKTHGYIEEAMGYLYSIISDTKKQIISEYTPTSKQKIIQPALDYINENFTDDTISIPHLAKLCGISEVYLRRMFGNIFGTSPLRYINELKMSRAYELIDSGMCSVHEAAERAGFWDDSYFSREFKKKYGFPPKSLISDDGNSR